MHLLWFCFAMLKRLTQNLAPLLNQSEVKTKPIFYSHLKSFPALYVSYMCLPGALIGSLDYTAKQFFFFRSSSTGAKRRKRIPRTRSSGASSIPMDPSLPRRFYTRSRPFVRISPPLLAFEKIRLFCSLGIGWSDYFGFENRSMCWWFGTILM